MSHRYRGKESGGEGSWKGTVNSMYKRKSNKTTGHHRNHEDKGEERCDSSIKGREGYKVHGNGNINFNSAKHCFNENHNDNC